MKIKLLDVDLLDLGGTYSDGDVIDVEHVDDWCPSSWRTPEGDLILTDCEYKHMEGISWGCIAHYNDSSVKEKPTYLENKTKTPLKDMTDEDKITILNALESGDAELYLKDVGWENKRNGIVNINLPYRVKATKPSIDWEAVSSDYNFLARDYGGRSFLYANKPTIYTTSDEVWSSGGYFYSASVFASYSPGTCDWKDSLVERPV